MIVFNIKPCEIEIIPDEAIGLLEGTCRDRQTLTLEEFGGLKSYFFPGEMGV